MRTLQNVEKILVKLAEINSGSTHFEGIKKVAKLLESYFSPLSSIEEIDLPEWGAPCLTLQKREDAPFQVLLVGHMDTVFPLESDFQTCQKLSPTKLQGPGVCDMKGGIVTLLLLLEELEKREEKKDLGWQVVFVPDEEIGSIHSKATLRSFCEKKDLAIVFEPQIQKGVFSRKRKGSLNIQVHVQGKAAHAGRDRQKGISAIHALTEWIYKSENIFKKRQAVSFNIGKIEGGISPNVVAKNAFCSFNLRSYSLKALGKAEDSLLLLAKKLEEKRGVEITLTRTSIRPPKNLIQAQKELHKTAKNAARKLGMTIAFEDTGGVCDGNEIASMGIPVLDSCGPYGGDIHTSSEWVDLPSIASQAKLMLEIILHAVLSKKRNEL